MPSKDNDWLDSIKNDGSNSGMLDILSKLSLAYPACSLILQKFKLPAKRSFINWFIKDFLVRCMIDIQVKPSTTDTESKEITFSLITKLQDVDQFIFSFISNLSGYNHVMTLSEQVVKNHIRT
jgi:hypothetical protein